MKRNISIALLVVMLFAASVFAGDLGLFNCPGFVGRNTSQASGTIQGSDSCLMVFCTQQRASSWQFFMTADTIGPVGDSTAVADDSLRILCRNLVSEEKGNITRKSGAVWSPVLWETGQDPYSVSEWIVFSGAITLESATPSDSSFVLGSGDACECYAETASTDTVGFTLEPAIKE